MAPSPAQWVISLISIANAYAVQTAANRMLSEPEAQLHAYAWSLYQQFTHLAWTLDNKSWAATQSYINSSTKNVPTLEDWHHWAATVRRCSEVADPLY